MYAVIKSGGKQYRVTQGEVIRLETIDAEPGAEFNFEEVLMVANGDDVKIGAPLLNAKVSAKVVTHGRGKKIEIIKFRRRKHHMKRQGHRQNFTEVEITGISA